MPTSDKQIENAIVIKTGDETLVQPLPMTTILATINQATNGWPRRVGLMLFAHDTTQEHVDWLDKSAALFGFLGSRTGVPPRFRTGGTLHTKGEVFEELRRVAQNYTAVEEIPHEPIIADD